MIKSLQSKVILELTKKLSFYFGQDSTQALKIDFKKDQSLVTEIDLFVSDLVKSEFLHSDKFNNFHFFSEEDHECLTFPSAILDPIDGTRELTKGIPECAVSLGLMNSDLVGDPLNYGWVYNPFTGFSMDSSVSSIKAKHIDKKKILGLVSRSEFERGYFDNFLKKDSSMDLSPRGSIAFKLGLLASGACDFVVSLSPKNIWDIAGGTIICHKRNIFLYQNGVLLENLKDVKINGILVWSSPELSDIIWQNFKSELKKN